MEKKIKRTWSVRDILISVIIAAIGVALLFTKSDSMFILGIVLIIFGGVLLLCLRTSFRLDTEQGAFRRKTANYPKTCKGDIIAFLEGKSDKMVKEAPGSLLLYVYYRPDMSWGFAELNDYEDYEYKPITDLLTLTSEQVKTILSA